jgi:hypothetical protein
MDRESLRSLVRRVADGEAALDAILASLPARAAVVQFPCAKKLRRDLRKSTPGSILRRCAEYFRDNPGKTISVAGLCGHFGHRKRIAVLSAASWLSRAGYLLQITTTPSSSGSLVFGVPCLSPVGATCTSEAELLQLGRGQVIETPPVVPLAGTTATLSTLAAYVTTGLVVGNVVFVQAGTGSYFAWSPNDTNMPNGSTIIMSTFATGNWLLCGTVTISIPAANVIPVLQGALYNLLVTWNNGTTTKLFEGMLRVGQTIVPAS